MRKNLIICVFLFIINSLYIYTQCHKKFACDDENLEVFFDEYDFKSQSAYAYLSNKDSAKVSIVLYSGQEYVIFVCSERELGNIDWKIVKPERKTIKKMIGIKMDSIVKYKTNEYGDYILDEKGDFIIESKKMITDTIWQVERITHYNPIYEKNKAEKPYFKISPQKTSSYTIYVKIGESKVSDYEGGCVNVYVGRKIKHGKTFRRFYEIEEKEKN